MSYEISSQTISSSLQRSVARLQMELAARSTELSTGEHADTGLFLGRQSGSLASFQAESELLEAIKNTNTLASAHLNTTETILGKLQNAAEGVLKALIGGDGSTTGASGIQDVAKAQLSALIAGLNSTQQGSFLFAGTNTATKPIEDYFSGSAANKQAVDSAFLAAFGISQTSSDVSKISGGEMQKFLDNQFAALFQPQAWKSDWSSAADETLSQEITKGQWVSTSVSANATPFRQLAEAYTMLADLGTQNLNKGALDAVTSTAQRLITSAIGGMTRLQTNVGTVQASIEDANAQLSIQTNVLSTQIGALENVNTYDVASRISELKTQIETSYSLTAQIRNLSLVNYI